MPDIDPQEVNRVINEAKYPHVKFQCPKCGSRYHGGEVRGGEVVKWICHGPYGDSRGCDWKGPPIEACPDYYRNPSDALEALEWWGRSSDDARYFELEWCESGCVATLGVVDEQDDDGSCRTIISCEYGDTYSAAIALAIYDAINTPHP